MNAQNLYLLFLPIQVAIYVFANILTEVSISFRRITSFSNIINKVEKLKTLGAFVSFAKETIQTLFVHVVC